MSCIFLFDCETLDSMAVNRLVNLSLAFRSAVSGSIPNFATVRNREQQIAHPSSARSRSTSPALMTS
jgi:hypothetical protein